MIFFVVGFCHCKRDKKNMPEGPEVHTIVDEIKSKIVGRSLISIEWDNESKYHKGLSNYEDLCNYLPMTITDVFAHGKQIFMILYRSYRVQDEDHEKKFYINITLGMEGKIDWVPSSHSNLWMNISTDNFIDEIIIIDDILYFDDSRHFGNVFILDQCQYEIKLKSIGPDLLTSEITEEEWFGKARNKRISNKQICDYLMEQKYFSGIGNYLKAEILYASRVKPDRIMSDLSDEDLRNLLHWSKNKITESYLSNGLTIRSYRSPEGKLGTFERVVYGKKFDPLGNPVVQSKFKDGRTTHWVPNLQV